MIINVHGGHNFNVKGAVGLIDETVEDRKVKDLVISKLKALGHTVYDCTDEDGLTQSANLSNIVKKCNANDVDLDISIHFNAFNTIAHGVETLIYSDNSKAKPYATNIVNNIAKSGLKNRGVKVRNNLYVLKRTKAPCVLVECCFCDNQEDVALYDLEKMANAIVEGIVSTATVKPTEQPKEEVKPTPTPKDDWIDRLNAECKKQGFSSYPTVKKGAKGNITKLIQERLNSVGFNLKTDGIFGSATHNGVKIFQRNRGLTQDGIVGKNTWSWLVKGTKMWI